MLRFAPDSAERVFAGKHGTGRHLLEQEEINELLVRLGRAGRTVVRLKGGDPFVFGRGAEEAEALSAAGLCFEIVPGVSAAFAVPAFAGIPVTHRNWVSGVTVLTGHEAGADAVEIPAIEITAPDSSAPLDAALDRLGEYDWVVFTSVNGVERFVAALDARGLDIRSMYRARLAAIGPETALAIERLHLKPDVVPRDHRAEGLLEAMRGESLAGARVLLPRAAAAREILPGELARAGARVDEVVTYRSRRPAASVERLREALAEGPLDAVAFTSSSTVTGFLSLLDELDPDGGRARLRGVCVACIGPITAATAQRAGLDVSVSADPYTVPSLVRAIADHFGAPRGAARAESSARGEES